MGTGLVIIVFTILEIAFLTFLGRAYLLYAKLKKNGLKAQGEIVDYDIQLSNKGKKTFFPIVKFKTYLGQEVNQKSQYGLDATQYLDKGAKVEIIYSENDPTRFMVEHYNPTKTIVIIFVAFMVSYALMLLMISYSNPNWAQDFLNAFK
jgi:hypothetical protein